MNTQRLIGYVTAVSIAMLATTAMAQDFSIDWYTLDNGGGYSSSASYEVEGTIGQHDAGAMTGGTFELNGGFWNTGVAGSTCTTAADCADLDTNGVTDDVCTWWECDAGTCISAAKANPSDMGGAFGACFLDTFCNLADALHALTCFSGNNAYDTINVDAGGAFGACPPDGFCNLADALHALTCFSGDNACACSPVPEFASEPNVVGQTSLTLVSDRRMARPGDEVQVRIFMSDAAAMIRAYQLHTAVSGGRRGTLDLVSITIEDRRNYVLGSANEVFDAINVEKSQMLAGMLPGNVEVSGGGYMATFTYQPSPDAGGIFVVDVLHDNPNGDQTFIVGAVQTDKIAVTHTEPAVIAVIPATVRSVR